MTLTWPGRAAPDNAATLIQVITRPPGGQTERVERVAVRDPARTESRPDLEAVFRSEYSRVVAVAARVLGARDEAEDVAQEVFLSFGRSAVPAAEAGGWLTIAAAHTALNVLRSGRRRTSREEHVAATDDVASPDVAEIVVTREERHRVRVALARLPQKQAVALVLRHSGLSYAEVAAALDLSPGSVGTTVRRAEAALRKELDVMRHANEGVLRRLIDEPAGVAEVDRVHVAECGNCLGELAGIRGDARLVDAALAEGSAEVDVDAAWQRFSASAQAPAPAVAPRQAKSEQGSWFRSALRRPAAAGLAFALVLGGAGTAAAGGWLPIFRTEQIAPVSITNADLVALPDLSAYGELKFDGEPDMHSVPDAAAAAAESGLSVPTVASLPRGVTGKPEFQVGRKVTATFTFSPAKAAQAAAQAGEMLPPPPPGLEGSSVRLEAGPGVAQAWKSSAGAPALLVGRAIAPTAFSSGIPFETVRDYVLSLPGLPENVAAQLRSFEADGSTLPLPLPAEYVTSRQTDINGAPATVVTTTDRTLAAVIWADNGVVTAVAGSLDEDEVLDIARELR